MQFGVLSLGDHLPDPHGGGQSQGERLRTTVEMGVRAEQLGFAMIAIGEHHFSDYIVSSPLVHLAAIAAGTESIRLSTAVTLMAIQDPVRLAEDFATVDQLSNGRLELVLGRGISADGYHEFGVDPSNGREALVERLELFRTLLASEEPVTWSGPFRPSLDGITVQPRPVQPDPRIWMGTGMSEESVRWTAGLGMPLMLPSIFRRAESWADMVALYRQLMAENGYADRAQVGVCSHIHLAPTSQQAETEWEPYLVQYANWANGIRGVTEPIDFGRIINGPAICASPAQAVERLESIQEALRPDIHLSVFDIGGIDEAKLWGVMELFATEVIPKVRVSDTVAA